MSLAKVKLWPNPEAGSVGNSHSVSAYLAGQPRLWSTTLRRSDIDAVTHRVDRM